MFNDQCMEDWYKCTFYWIICPFLLIIGASGCIASLAVMSGSGFKGSTFFFLKALSLTDLFYLVLAIGYFVEMIIINDENVGSMFFVTFFDLVLCNALIATSGFIIILLTIDRYRSICHPTLPQDSSPCLRSCAALAIGCMLQVPRFLDPELKGEEFWRECLPLLPDDTIMTHSPPIYKDPFNGLHMLS